MKYIALIFLISIMSDIICDRQSDVLKFCYDNIGKDYWSYSKERTSIDKKLTVESGKYKCNLFVYEALVSGGVNVPLFYDDNGKAIAPNTKNWYNEEVEGFRLVGQGLEALDKSWPGDIIVLYKSSIFPWDYEHHIGIISGPQKTISASGLTNEIVENDWGWRTNQWTQVKVFRYNVSNSMTKKCLCYEYFMDYDDDEEDDECSELIIEFLFKEICPLITDENVTLEEIDKCELNYFCGSEEVEEEKKNNKAHYLNISILFYLILFLLFF